MSKAFALPLFLSIAVLVGCASNKPPCLHDHKIVTAKADSASVHISYVDVRHEGDTLTVSGAIKRHDTTSQSLETHIDISVFDENGNLLKQARTDKIHVPCKQVGKGPNFARFKAVVPVDVRQNITVSAAPHADHKCGI